MSTMRRSPLLLFLMVMVSLGLLPFQAMSARGFGAYTAEVTPAEVFPGAERFGPREGAPPAMAAYKDGKVAGYVFEAGEIGYSGKPIRILVGMDATGVVVGAKTIEHHEPILLVGIPEEKLFDFVSAYIGRNVITAAGKQGKVDVISGATVTGIVINDALTRTALRVARTRGVAGFKAVGAGAAPVKRKIVPAPFAPADWQTLLGDGSVRRLRLLNGDVDEAFRKIGVGSPEPYAKAGPADEDFIDLYVALATPETIGRNLLGAAEYDNLMAWLAPGQSAIVILANGAYSFRGSGFVRGAIFDRIQVVQDDIGILFRDSHYRRLGSLAPGMPDFAEIGLFKLPADAVFDPAAAWRLDLLAQRPIGPIEKSYTSFSLPYAVPDRFLEPVLAPPPPPNTPQGDLFGDDGRPPVWEGIWRDRIADIGILSAALVVLTGIFFFQDILVRNPKMTDRIRLGFLVFTAVWIGGYAQAQLSVVNALTFFNALVSGFRWDFFLLEPLIFILWSATAVALIFWGRGAYCGWLCPFGALQELLNRLARMLKVPQITVPFGLHERLWPIKYLLFTGLLGLSLYSMATAELLAEVEPFKTVILLRMAREWPFVVYAATLLAAGLFIERFFCRYLCPLGGGLAIPARMRTFDWLKRRRQCGYECTICARQCGVQAIHSNGAINPNECFYCLKCQANHSDATVCPPLILRRAKRERRGAAAGAGAIGITTNTGMPDVGHRVTTGEHGE